MLRISDGKAFHALGPTTANNLFVRCIQTHPRNHEIPVGSRAKMIVNAMPTQF